MVDNTDFGAVAQSSLQQRSFTIINDTNNVQTLGVPAITGPFSLVGGFPRSLAPHASISFTLGLNTSAIGNYAGSISFGTSVIGLSPYNFSLAAQVIPEPRCAAIAVALVAFGSMRQGRRA